MGGTPQVVVGTRLLTPSGSAMMLVYRDQGTTTTSDQIAFARAALASNETWLSVTLFGRTDLLVNTFQTVW